MPVSYIVIKAPNNECPECGRPVRNSDLEDYNVPVHHEFCQIGHTRNVAVDPTEINPVVRRALQ